MLCQVRKGGRLSDVQMIKDTRLMRGHNRATFIVTSMASVACKINRRISIQQPPYQSVKHSKQSEASSLICQTFSCKEDPGRIVEKQEVTLSSQITMAIRPPRPRYHQPHGHCAPGDRPYVRSCFCQLSNPRLPAPLSLLSPLQSASRRTNDTQRCTTPRRTQTPAHAPAQARFRLTSPRVRPRAIRTAL
jgi:hypothetical protein